MTPFSLWYPPMAKSLKDTLNLPETDFPMRANLAKREPERIAHWEEQRLYERILEKNKDGPSFILHDGPPFTNGDIHLGHILDKTLKEIILRYRSMQGYRAPYRVGWDCHGLPIEHAVSRDIQKKGTLLSAVEIRQACTAFAERYIKIQGEQFRRLGIYTDWENPYKTLDPSYEAEILRTFAKFVEQGLVYQSKKPVYWSIPCATALAEAEIEYRPHTSPSIWVAFPLTDAGVFQDDAKDAELNIVIWTTTPWTLPANLAVAVHPRLDYLVVKHGGKGYIVAQARADDFIEQCQLEGAQLGAPQKGAALEGLIARHTFIERNSPIVLADYVTTDAGTGCVHIAPGHGLEDYHTGLQNHLDVYCPLDDQACYTDDGQVPTALVGLSVLDPENGLSPANKAVLAILKENKTLLGQHKLEHSYPHCWRSKTPVVFRAMDQWFISLNEDLRAKALAAIDETTWLPKWGKSRITAAVENRPDWCISRQRCWGVPLPVFFDENNRPYLDAQVIRNLADKVEQQGTDFWFEGDAEAILDGVPLPDAWQDKNLQPGSDTLDVWIDSGVSHAAVLKKDPQLNWPADLYLEGSDQHRGWFQSSLWTALLTDGAPPYKTVLTHGFVVNQEGTKLSKKDGAQSATHYLNTLGADILRLLIASEDYSSDVPFSEAIVKQISGAYRLFRNTLRFQIGNLYDFDRAKDAVPLDDLLSIDRWALHETAGLIQAVTQAYEDYAFHKVYQQCNRFCAVSLSALYHDILKDRLYTQDKTSIERRSGQTAIALIHDVLVRLLAPILAFTTDEAWAYAHSGNDFCDDAIHLQSFPKANEGWIDTALAEKMTQIFKIRDQVNDKLEGLRQEKVIGQGLDAAVSISGAPDDPVFQALKAEASNLAELFIVSQVTLHTEPDTSDLNISVEKAGGIRCPRCWRWVADLVDAPLDKVCPRCKPALETESPAT